MRAFLQGNTMWCGMYRGDWIVLVGLCIGALPAFIQAWEALR